MNLALVLCRKASADFCQYGAQTARKQRSNSAQLALTFVSPAPDVAVPQCFISLTVRSVNAETRDRAFIIWGSVVSKPSRKPTPLKMWRHPPKMWDPPEHGPPEHGESGNSRISLSEIHTLALTFPISGGGAKTPLKRIPALRAGDPSFYWGAKRSWNIHPGASRQNC